MVVLSPLLSVAGFYRRPFRPTAEKQVEIAVEEAGEIVRGRMIIFANQSRQRTFHRCRDSSTIRTDGTQYSGGLGICR